MKVYDRIQVLWVEDDSKVIDTYPEKAEIFGLELKPFSCWDDAKVALKNDYDRWSAIILDAKCKHHRNSADNAIKFLSEALADIKGLSKEKGRVIPWYVLTGGDEKEISDLINDDRQKWDKEWTKTYYSKNGDDVELYNRIKDQVQQSPRIQVLEKYHNVFRQLSLLNEKICEHIYTILETMHYPHLHQEFIPSLYYNPMRTALEYVYRDAREVGIIPDEFFSKGKVNLNQCFMFLIGNNADHIGYRYGELGERIVPQHIQDMMSLIINLGNSSSHSIEDHETELSNEEMQKYDDYIEKNGGNSKLLIFSIALQFCEIVQWMKKYIERHSNKEQNRQKFVKIGKIECDEKGFYHAGEYSLIPPKKISNPEGKKILILKYSENTNNKTNNIYPLFAEKYQIIE